MIYEWLAARILKRQHEQHKQLFLGVAKRSEQEKKGMDFAQQENKNSWDILAYSRIYILPYRYINSTKNVEKG